MSRYASPDAHCIPPSLADTAALKHPMTDRAHFFNFGDEIGLQVCTSRHPGIRRLKSRHTTRLHGNKLWGAAWLLIDYIRRHPPPLQSHILDVGCGWGLPGIWCARHYGAHVTAVDADPAVFPYLELHAELNHVEISTVTARFDALTEQQLAGFDWLVAADICFWDDMVDPVFDLVERACAAGVGKIIIADPQRPPFWEMAERCVEHFYGEIEPGEIKIPRIFQGALLIIENG